MLVEREWLQFGHKFAERCGQIVNKREPRETSPVFIQWLDVIHQLLLQFPAEFEFNEAYLVSLFCQSFRLRHLDSFNVYVFGVCL